MKPRPHSVLADIRASLAAPRRTHSRALGATVRAWRKARELEQKAVAERLLISQSAYSRLENGDTRFSAEQLFAVCEVLDVDANTIAGQLRELLK